jgi:hypothetical protein
VLSSKLVHPNFSKTSSLQAAPSKQFPPSNSLQAIPSKQLPPSNSLEAAPQANHPLQTLLQFTHRALHKIHKAAHTKFWAIHACLHHKTTKALNTPFQDPVMNEHKNQAYKWFTKSDAPTPNRDTSLNLKCNNKMLAKLKESKDSFASWLGQIRQIQTLFHLPPLCTNHWQHNPKRTANKRHNP